MKLMMPLLLSTLVATPAMAITPSVDSVPAETPRTAATPEQDVVRDLGASAAPKLFEINGFFLPMVNYGSDTIASFGNNNTSASTEAGAPSGRSHLSFQSQQSRFGVKINVSSDVRGKVEVDLLDATKSSPTVASVPRIRIAKIEYDPMENLTIFAGQDWDLFSPLNPFGYNFVGGEFRSGNAGFMRQQIGVTAKPFRNGEAAASIGFASPNGLANEQAQELEKKPAYSARVAYVLGKFRTGLSGIYSQNGYFNQLVGTTTSTLATNRASYAGNFFAEYAIGAFEVKGEAYHGQNPANINLLTIGQGTAAAPSLKETGGYVSAKYKFEKVSIWTTLGMAAVHDGAEVINDASTKGFKGMQSNRAFKVGADYGLTDKLRVFYEVSFFRTKYVAGAEHAALHSAGLFLPL